MIVLKQVLHDTKTNSVEATWVKRTIAPDTVDKAGNTVAGIVTDVQVKCHSYADVQMGMLEADIGVDVTQHAALIAKVRAEEIKRRPPPPTAQELADRFAPIKAAQIDAVRIAREQIIDRLGGMAGRRHRASDAATASACDAAVLKLLDLTARPDVLAAADAAQLKSAVLAGYAEAKALLPLAMQNAFRGLDA